LKPKALTVCHDGLHLEILPIKGSNDPQGFLQNDGPFVELSTGGMA
jgi:hypothetical protein